MAAVLVPRARRRGAWDAELGTAEQEARWLAHELLPQLQQARSADEVAGGWQVAQGRARQVEDQLTGLASTAPDEARQIRSRDLRDAVRSARQDVDGLLVERDPVALAAGLASIAGRLSGVLDRGTG